MLSALSALIRRGLSQTGPTLCSISARAGPQLLQGCSPALCSLAFLVPGPHPGGEQSKGGNGTFLLEASDSVVFGLGVAQEQLLLLG